MRAKERQALYRPIIIDQFPPIQIMRERIAYGLLSWTLLNRGERWMRKEAVASVRFGFQTGSEIARDYLDFYHPNRLRATGRQAEMLKLDRAAPLFCEAGYYSDMVYVDIKSAYWQITNLVGWDVDYYPFKWIRCGRPPSDFPLPDNKIARNCLVSCCLPTPMKVWTGYKFVRERKRNVHINLGLWSLIMDTLHCIANEAWECHAVYTHTDGSIIPIRYLEEFTERVSAYGIVAIPKQDSLGDCTMLGLGNWKCGDRQTKLFNKARLKRNVDTLYRPDDTLIRRKLRKFRDNPSMMRNTPK